MSKIAEYCSCGAAMTGTVFPPAEAADLVAIFWGAHEGAGHERVTARQAAAARRRVEKAQTERLGR